MAEQMQHTPGLRLTPEKREQLRRLTEAVEHGTAPVITHEADLAARAFREIERLRKGLEQLEAARAEAERWCKQYEALRVGVERVADDLHMTADEAYDNWRITADFNEQGLFIGLEKAEQMVRRLLTEADKNSDQRTGGQER